MCAQKLTPITSAIFVSISFVYEIIFVIVALYGPPYITDIDEKIIADQLNTNCSECRWRTLNRKGQLRHRAVSSQPDYTARFSCFILKNDYELREHLVCVSYI